MRALFRTATHVVVRPAHLPNWTCVPILSCLNHDGKGNGIVLVQVVFDPYGKWISGHTIHVGASMVKEMP